jgi:primosomal replication protein N
LNQLAIRAVPIERAALRYTPAGVAVAEFGFRHEGAVTEAGSERSLDFEFSAIALGPVASALHGEPLGQALTLNGFIAPRSRRSQRLIVHITEYARGV